MPDRVIFVRQPVSESCVSTLQIALREIGEAGRPGLVFLHGDAVDLACDLHRLELPENVAMMVCQSSWARRHSDAVPAPARSSTLAMLLQAIEQAQTLTCLGLGGQNSGPPTPRPAEPLLVEIAFEADRAVVRREALEVALAVAAMGLDGRVLFSGSGYNHLLAEDSRGWLQLTDFDLLELVWIARLDLRAGVPVRPIDADGAASLRADAGRHLLL